MVPNSENIELAERLYPYFDPKYDSKERFCSYWHQINEIISVHPKRVLEIGIGNGFVNRYLREKRVNITTVDTAHILNPDVVGSVLSLPFYASSFDVVSCYEVLEHLPYKDFPSALAELARVSSRSVILSVPDVTTVYRINIELPRMRPIKRLIPHPRHRPAYHEFDGEHYWEIGKLSYPLERIVNDIIDVGVDIRKTYRVFEFYYHRFFILEVK